MQDVIKMMYILVEAEDTSSISSPLKTTNRIKFLSFAVSESYIVFGASSGGLYVFDRESFTFNSLVPSKEGPVTCVKISPDEKWFGFSTTRGISCVLEHSGSSVNRRILSHVHEGRNVTALQWNSCSSQLYVGDNSGQISVISVSSYLTPAVALMQLDSSIVQLDTCGYMLLVSTITRSFLCDTLREQYRQIGTRLRDGEFGGCFYQVDSHEPFLDHIQDEANHKNSHGPFSSLNDGEWLLADDSLQNVKLFCARPGLRLWEVRIDGAVISTHQFKQLLLTLPVNVIRPSEVGIYLEADDVSLQTPSLQFTKLCKLSSNFLLTYDSNGLCVLDPMTSEVVLWTNQFKNVIDVHVVDEVIYLWMGGSKLHAVCFTAIDKFLVRLYLQKRYVYCAQLCAAHLNILKKLAHSSLKLYVLSDLLQKIKEEGSINALDEEVMRKTKELLDEVTEIAQNQDQAQMLKSGIFIVGNAHLLSQREDVRIPKSLEKRDVNDMVNILSNLSRKQDSQQDEGEQTGRDTMNGLFKKSILPSMSSLTQHFEQANIMRDEDYDPFPDLPLSSLTSTETILALKNLTSTVSGTITNSTKSLREKWQNLEDKFRWQDGSGLSVEKSINKLTEEVSNFDESYFEDSTNILTETPERSFQLPTADLIKKCIQIESGQGVDGRSFDELAFEMFDSFILLYGNFRQSSMVAEENNASSIGHKKFVYSNHNWPNCRDITPFPFLQHLEKSFLSTLSKHFQTSLRSGSLRKWILQFVNHVDLDYSIFPSHIGRIHSKKSLLLDQAMGRFLRMCSALLDPHSTLQSLEASGCPCHYYSWNVVMDHFQENLGWNSAFLEDSEHIQMWSLPRTLSAMLILLQLGQVESCRNIGKHVAVRHVLRTMLRMNENPLQISKLFLLYLENKTDLLMYLKDPEVYYFTRQSLESLYKARLDDQCSCGYPIKEIKFAQTSCHVGHTLLSYIYQTDGLSEAVTLCQRTGVFWHHLLVLRRNQGVEDVLPLILHAAAQDELKNRCSELSPSTWDLLFQLRGKLEQGFCLYCDAKLSSSPSTIPWISLATLLLRKNSATFCLKLLSKYSDSIPAGSISLEFYQSCLLASVTEGPSTKLTTNVLDLLIPSQEMPVMSQELAGRVGLPHSEGQHHWGLQLQVSKSHCFCCLLPIAASSGGPCFAFECHHTFHSICLQQRVLKLCPICSKS